MTWLDATSYDVAGRHVILSPAAPVPLRDHNERRVLEWARQSVVARARADERAARAAEEAAGVVREDFVVGGFLHMLLS